MSCVAPGSIVRRLFKALPSGAVRGLPMNQKKVVPFRCCYSFLKISDRSILNLQTRYPPEFIGVVRYQNQLTCHDLPGNQHLVWTNGRSLDGQGGADFAGLPGVFLVEIEYLESLLSG